MSRKTKEEAEKTRSRILASALSLFVKKGYEHTTFTDVAARLKMTKGAVYWHFESKEELLVELVRLAFARFQRQIRELMPEGELTFPAVADMMVANARRVVEDPRGAAFFKLMKCQIRWADESMASVREKLIGSDAESPKQAIRAALENDIRAGRARGIDAEEVATVVIAIWDGLVQARLDGFLACDMEGTLRHSYEAIWRAIAIDGCREQSSRGRSTAVESNRVDGNRRLSTAVESRAIESSRVEGNRRQSRAVESRAIDGNRRRSTAIEILTNKEKHHE